MPDIAWPRLIYDGGRWSALSWPRLIQSIRTRSTTATCGGLENIGAEHQGKGYGRFAVEGLCQEAMRRGQRRLTVCYHPFQHGPEGFYRRLDFHPTGEYIQDEVVAERILSPTATISS